MNNKIKDTEKIETKNLESIPSKNDLPDVKSKEHYEKLVIERRLNSYEKSKNTQETSSSEDAQEVSTEDLNDVAGGKIFPLRRRRIPGLEEHIITRDIYALKYAGPCKEPSISPEEWKKIKERIEEERKKLKEKDIENPEIN